MTLFTRDNAQIPSEVPLKTTALPTSGLQRRRFVLGAAAAASATGLAGLSLAAQVTASELQQNLSRGPRLQPASLSGREFDLHVGYQKVNFTGRERIATTVNESLPAPILRWREGDDITLRVTNHLPHDTSIHWHGLILPANMDGVPGMSFTGIKPGETFTYRFTVQQSGTYWYHSHSGFQEQTGLYGPIVIDPKEPEPLDYQRDYVVQLSDWSDEDPHAVYAKLKKSSGYYNFRERTLGDFWHDVKTKGFANTWQNRAMWNRMRMSATDIADVTGYTYTYLMNGETPARGWLGLFQPGEKIRLRFINSSAMSIFDVRIPGLAMTVIAADGQAVQPVTVDEFRIGTAETYDVIVEPQVDQAYTLFAQANDRSGFARGTLASANTPSREWQSHIPALDPAPVLTHADMGMAMTGMGDMTDMHGKHNAMKPMPSEPAAAAMTGMHDMHGMSHREMLHMNHQQMDAAPMVHGDMVVQHSTGKNRRIALAGLGNSDAVTPIIAHGEAEFGPQVDSRAAFPKSGLNDPGVGLRDHSRTLGRRVLTYADLRSLYPTRDKRQPSREIQLHLTGNMNRYMWSINGINFADAKPLQLQYGERVRITLVNDTMMIHPIHLHGMWSELETGDPDFIPRKHTVLVQPGARISYLVTADAKGNWAYHCHLMYHMLGMMREVTVSDADREVKV